MDQNDFACHPTHGINRCPGDDFIIVKQGQVRSECPSITGAAVFGQFRNQPLLEIPEINVSDIITQDKWSVPRFASEAFYAVQFYIEGRSGSGGGQTGLAGGLDNVCGQARIVVEMGQRNVKVAWRTQLATKLMLFPELRRHPVDVRGGLGIGEQRHKHPVGAGCGHPCFR